MFEEVVDEEVELHKTDMITVTVSNKSRLEGYDPDFKKPILVVKYFDSSLEYAVFTINRHVDENDDTRTESGKNVDNTRTALFFL